MSATPAPLFFLGINKICTTPAAKKSYYTQINVLSNNDFAVLCNKCTMKWVVLQTYYVQYSQDNNKTT